MGGGSDSWQNPTYAKQGKSFRFLFPPRLAQITLTEGLDGIGREPGWGAGAEDVLDRLATRMQEARTLEVSKVEMRAPAEVVQGLLSRGVLVETERGYAFAHQELLDLVAVRAARRRSERLRDFVATHPALPFLRPTVRVFLHVLRAESTTQYRREVRAFLSDEEIAYHLRRLVAETLAEVAPEAEDVPLLRWMMRSHADLFERFLQRALSLPWMEIVVSELLPAARREEEAERWTSRLLHHLERWAGARPDVVLSTWRRALDEAWPGSAALDHSVSSGLEAVFRAGDRDKLPWDDAEWLIRRLVQEPSFAGESSYLVGPVVQAWIEAGGSDDLLLEFLNLEGTIDTAERNLGRRIRSLTRRVEPSALSTDFLASRMAESEAVIDAVLGYVLREAEDESRKYWGLLRETSWRARHNRGIMSHDSLNDVLKALEEALIQRATRNDEWWRRHERSLTTHKDTGILYLALQAMRRKPEQHVSAISALLTDPDTYEHSYLESEIDELTHAVYPFLSAEAAAAHQALVLSLGTPGSTDTEDWMIRVRRSTAYDHLLWIPRPYRSPEAEEFIAEWEGDLGPYRSEPRIYMSSGFVGSPVSAKQIQDLTDEGVLRVINFWGITERGREAGMELVGGWDHVVRSVSEAAMNVPVRALGWLEVLIATDAPIQYRDACVEGIATHLRARFGGLNPGTFWAPVDPLPDGEELAGTLLQILERHAEAWISEHTVSDCVQACSAVLKDENSAVRLVHLLETLSRSSNPDGALRHEPAMEALNSTRGEAATAAVLLAVGITESNRKFPELLTPLLHRFAGDARPGVRWAVLRALPPLTESSPDLAWDLFDEATATAGTAEWEVAEISLYYNYHRHFNRVGPILERIRATAMDIAGAVYGRIGALAFLSNHIAEASLFSALRYAAPPVWQGVVEVFASNVGDTPEGVRCGDSLVHLLNSPDLPDAAVEQGSVALAREDKRNRVPRRVVEALLNRQLANEDYEMRIHSIVEWVAEEAKADALGILDVLEKLVEGLDAGRFRGFYGGRNLVPTLTAVMREADETDDPALIARVVAVQDRLLRLGIDEVDRMLDAASRP